MYISIHYIYYIIYIQKCIISICSHTFYLFRNSWNTFICRNLPSLCMRSIASVTRRTGLDCKNETWRFAEFRDFAENGKLIILSREGRSNENLDRAPVCVPSPPRDASQSLPRLWPFPSVVSLGALNPRPFSVRSLVFSRPMYVLVLLNSVSR